MKNNIYQFTNNQINNNKFISSKITVTNNKLDYSEIIVRKPWGYEYIIYQNKNICVTILNIKKGHQTSMHCHPRKKTTLIVLDGKVITSNLIDKKILNNGDGVEIDKKVFHQTSAKNGDAIVMEIESPNMKQDLLRIKDSYGREKMGYEKKDKFSINTRNYNYINFESKTTYHNITKKFGKSSISFLSINNINQLKKLIKENSNCLFTIIEGKIKYFEKSYNKTNTFKTSDFKNYENISMIGKKILMIRNKIDDKQTKISDLILNILDNHDFNVSFSVPGDTNLHLIDSLGKKESFNNYFFNNEFNASYAALGYAKKYQRPSILFLSSGHSVLKALEATYAAYIDSEPMIIISGQASSDQSTRKNLRQFGNKSVDIISIVKKITKFSKKITNINNIPFALEQAIFFSMNDRPGPVWIDIPIDFLGKTITEEKTKHFYYNKFQSDAKFADISLKILEIYNLINKSKKPLLLLGYGINNQRAKQEVLKLVTRLKIPVLTSRRGADLLSNNNKLYFGRPGVFGNRYSNFIVQNCDLFISIGSRLSIPLIGRDTSSFAKNAKKVIVDVDENELNKKTIKSDISIKFSADEFINLMLNTNNKVKKFNNWLNECNKYKKTYSFKNEQYSNNSKVNPYLFTYNFSKYVPNNSTVVMDGGAIMNYVMQGFFIKSNQRLITSSGLDNEGFAFPASLGMISNKDKSLIICLCEEKSFLNSINDFSNIYKYNIPIKIICYSGIQNVALRSTQNDFFGKRFIGTLFDDNYIKFKYKILNNIGIKPIIIDNLKDIVEKSNHIFKNNNPQIVYVNVDINHTIKPKLGFSLDYDGIWKPKPLDEMYPFIKKTIKGKKQRK
ncbi:MAG: Acetolactate synthase isozyme 2 large subunit [Alphaproteobacteria bacterium MarineAlpha5_Bin6]|nr:MAG: Acetolactate synthase isozyme 2 large subunit [Alphaproteobacteria bacterium MarineAlpha5_Bin6]|tara:strand:+ start:883 stop:3417 length:2535 start_codon:yes stop_codon:yes gene_type:complete